MADAPKGLPPMISQFQSQTRQRSMDPQKLRAFEAWIAKNPQYQELGAPLIDQAKAILAAPRASARPATSPSRKGPPEESNAEAAAPEVLGGAFHNPYTFLPFPTEPPTRREPTPLTIDEIAKDRFTGTMELTIEARSPLLTSAPRPEQNKGHQTYDALTIGDHVVVPATGIRGSLRSLLSYVAGATLGYVDDEVWLCQGRDARLGPPAKGDTTAPTNQFLAEVVISGDRTRPGRVQLGRTRLVKAEELERVYPRLYKRPDSKDCRTPDLWIDEANSRVIETPDPGCPWRLKLSGKPVNRKGKKEGAFLATGPEIELPSELWLAYTGRHRHSGHPELRKGDLVWLEPVNPGVAEIRSAADVKSIQWSRWGRTGQRLLDALPKHLRPDSMNADGQVDEITDLFGMVPAGSRQGPGDRRRSFAARVRPENLVFRGAARNGLERKVTLAPMGAPHPGAMAFYRPWDGTPEGLDGIRNAGPLRGVKVYRTTLESGSQAPWRFEVQGVYDPEGRLGPSRQEMNRTCDLLKAGQTGTLRIALRGLSARELALLLAACSVDWRLGGGKPLGLGWCRVKDVQVLDEEGRETHRMSRSADEAAAIPPVFLAKLTEADRRRLQAWQASQLPVPKLRYPRAVDENNHRKQRGGHVWFSRHAAPKKAGQGGLQILRTNPTVQERLGTALPVRAQALPPFRPEAPTSDLLYGHDLLSRNDGNSPRRHDPLEPFDPDVHRRPGDQSGGNQGGNRDSRQQERRNRP